ncbi:MAG: gas vesicle protein [Phycisphaerales bacterium]
MGTTPVHSTGGTNLADLLERILDKGVVIAGDVKIKLVDIELLSIQLRLVVCSVDKAKEMGMDWWVNNPAFMAQPEPKALPAADRERALEQRVAELEAELTRGAARSISAPPGGA